MTKSSKKSLHFLLFLIFVVGCSTGQKTKLEKIKLAKGVRPTWIESPGDLCLKSQLCGTGEGSSFLAAEMSARESLAKYFEVRVQGSSEFTNNMQSTREGDVTLSFKNEEDLLRKIKSSTDQKMEGVEILKRYEDKDRYYALASLNKRKVSSIIEAELVDLGDRIDDLIKSGSRYDLNQALELVKLFDQKYIKYQLLGNRAKYTKPFKRKILDLKAQKRALGTTIFFKIKPSGNSELERVIKEELIKLDYQLVRKKKISHDYAVEVKLSWKEEHLNVKGFNKYRFNINVSSFGKNGTGKGVIGHAVTASGRSYQDAYRKSIKDIEKYIIENLDKLRID